MVASMVDANLVQLHFVHVCPFDTGKPTFGPWSHSPLTRSWLNTLTQKVTHGLAPFLSPAPIRNQWGWLGASESRLLFSTTNELCPFLTQTATVKTSQVQAVGSPSLSVLLFLTVQDFCSLNLCKPPGKLQGSHNDITTHGQSVYVYFLLFLVMWFGLHIAMLRWTFIALCVYPPRSRLDRPFLQSSMTQGA